MSYKINLSIINRFGDNLTVVEKTCWYYADGGTWVERDGHHILSIGGSGTSGMLRFESSTGEKFALAVGVHNYAVWCDLLVDLKSDDTIVRIHPTYYKSNDPRHQMLWNNLNKLERKTDKGRVLTIEYFRDDGHELLASLTSETTSMTSPPLITNTLEPTNSLELTDNTPAPTPSSTVAVNNTSTTSAISTNNGESVENMTPSTSQELGSYVQINPASNLPEFMHSREGDFRLIKLVLGSIGHPQIIDVFHKHDITDLWLPFLGENLPYGLTPGILKRFKETQTYHIGRGANIEKGKHCHLSDDDLDDEDCPKTLKYVEYLGSGGFGSVIKVNGEKEYALKRIRRGQTFDTTLKVMRYFDSELRILKKVTQQKSFHFVTLVGSYTSAKWVGLVMSPVADFNLENFLKICENESEWTKRKLLWKFFGCLACAVVDLHFELGVRHKDIKPSNILVKGNRVLITDFGMALDWSDGGKTTTHEDLRKTPAFCAPEVARNEARNSTSDIWSLGCVYLEMITVLKRKSIKDMKKFFKSKGSQDGFYYDSQQGIEEWVKMLRETEVTDLDFENDPLDWIEKMLQPKRKLRPTARELRISISNVPPQSGVVLSCDRCREL